MTISTSTNGNGSCGRVCPDGERRVLVFSSLFPSSTQPAHGVFVKERVRFLAKRADCRIEVLSPVPYFPPLPVFAPWYALSKIPAEESIDGLPIKRTRYFLLPKVGKYFHDRSMAYWSSQVAERMQRQFDFDLIDAHFAFPDGVAAMHLAKRFDKPLVITGRGTDIIVAPDDPAQRPRIVRALKHATRLVAVSDEIAEAMCKLGAPENRIRVIPNGVDTDRFQPRPSDECRAALGLPRDRPIVLSVGHMLERKGFHLLVDAIPALRRAFPEVLVVIVGGRGRASRDFSRQVRKRIKLHGVADHVLLIGPQPHERLASWYSAADVFALLSSREGCPNVLIESLSCSVPAVATPVGHTVRVLEDDRLGILLPERSAEAAAAGLTTALSQNWDRKEIRRQLEKHTWDRVAGQIAGVYEEAISDYSRDGK